ELNVEEFRLQSHMALGHRTFLPRGGEFAIDADGDRLARAGDVIGVPLADGSGELVARAFAKDFQLAAGPSGEELAGPRRLIPMGDLSLVPDFAVFGGADVDAAVVVLAAFDFLEAPLDVKDAVAEFALIKQHLLDADAIADQVLGFRIDAPRVLVGELHIGRNRHTAPALEVLAGHEVDPIVFGRLRLGADDNYRHERSAEWCCNPWHGEGLLAGCGPRGPEGRR